MHPGAGKSWDQVGHLLAVPTGSEVAPIDLNFPGEIFFWSRLLNMEPWGVCRFWEFMFYTWSLFLITVILLWRSTVFITLAWENCPLCSILSVLSHFVKRQALMFQLLLTLLGTRPGSSRVACALWPGSDDMRQFLHRLGSQKIWSVGFSLHRPHHHHREGCHSAGTHKW